MAATWLVTISALLRYAKDAKAAQDKLNDAKSEMKNAAEALCQVWQGDAATAFAAEQGVLDNWFNQLIEIGSEYINAVTTAAKKIQDAEVELSVKIHG